MHQMFTKSWTKRGNPCMTINIIDNTSLPWLTRHICYVWTCADILKHLSASCFNRQAHISECCPVKRPGHTLYLTLRAASVQIGVNMIGNEGLCSWTEEACCVVAPEQWEAGWNYRLPMRDEKGCFQVSCSSDLPAVRYTTELSWGLLSLFLFY